MTRPALLAALLFVTLSGFTLAWTRYDFDDGGFSILLPSQPQVSSSEVETDSGPLTMNTIVATEKNAAYMVAFSDLPTTEGVTPEPSVLLKGARDGVAQRFPGTIISERALTLHGHPGTQIEILSNEEGFRCRARLYVVGLRLYQMIAIGPKGKSMPRNTDKFLTSFTLTAP